MPKSTEFEELAQLLKSWNVSELLPHLQDEAINTQELQMIKRHHLKELLRNFRFGTRIRFEHHLERWRRWLNVPLQDAADDRLCNGACQISCASEDTQVLVKTQAKEDSLRLQQQQQQQQLLLQQQQQQLQAVQQQQQQQPQQQQQQLPSEPFVSLNEVGDGSSFNVPLPLSDHHDLHTELVQTELLKPELVEQDTNEESGVTVLSILHASPTKAQSLLERIGQNVQLDAVQRLLLIQLICSYYEDNRLHLTLQRSHLLEREILQLFPMEQLCFYRTERRGKIYVRFTNMKRNKRFGKQSEAKRRREEQPIVVQNAFTKTEVTFSGDPMSSPERSD
ncbi:CG1888 [Drosophila busckii]|uniref:CG1888 n=1 Tax=Drosophila busckii TaxID=30019 RepID=A0A0M4EJK7_DROBS|nr:ras-interacting protein RIP3 [Drosophila busckii]ALC41455.1 CG1888 [Drosophila busckii]